MRLLLDTAVFLWLSIDRRRISRRALEACASDDNELFLSAVSAWEIAVKYSLGNLKLPETPSVYVPSRRTTIGAASLPLDEASAVQISKLPMSKHKDPFDRMLVCQAIMHGMVIVSPDLAFDSYPVHRLW